MYTFIYCAKQSQVNFLKNIMDKTNIEVVDNAILDYSKKLFRDMKLSV